MFVNKKYKKGFSLYETLIAIFILTFTVASAMLLVQKSLSSSTYSRDQVTASFLAQDAMEFIRNIRDSNFIMDTVGGGAGWMDNILSACLNGQTCQVDTTPGNTGGNIQHCNLDINNTNACRLTFNTTTGEYSHTPVNSSEKIDSKFYRYFTINSVSSANTHEKKVTVYVVWIAGPFNQQTYKVEENILDYW